MPGTISRALLSCATLITLTVGAYAQAAPAPAAPEQPAQPAVTDLKDYQDWTVRCFTIQSPAPCDMSQIVLDDNSKKRLMQVSIGYSPSTDTYATQIIVPLGVAIAQGMTLSSGDYRAAHIPFSRCMRDGCYVEAKMDAEAIQALNTNSTATITVIGWGDAHVFDLPLSLKGFADAHAAMVKLNRAKAVAVPAPAQPAPEPSPAPSDNR